MRRGGAGEVGSCGHGRRRLVGCPSRNGGGVSGLLRKSTRSQNCPMPCLWLQSADLRAEMPLAMYVAFDVWHRRRKLWWGSVGSSALCRADVRACYNCSAQSQVEGRKEASAKSPRERGLNTPQWLERSESESTVCPADILPSAVETAVDAGQWCNAYSDMPTSRAADLVRERLGERDRSNRRS